MKILWEGEKKISERDIGKPAKDIGKTREDATGQNAVRAVPYVPGVIIWLLRGFCPVEWNR